MSKKITANIYAGQLEIVVPNLDIKGEDIVEFAALISDKFPNEFSEDGITFEGLHVETLGHWYLKFKASSPAKFTPTKSLCMFVENVAQEFLVSIEKQHIDFIVDFYLDTQAVKAKEGDVPRIQLLERALKKSYELGQAMGQIIKDGTKREEEIRQDERDKFKATCKEILGLEVEDKDATSWRNMLGLPTDGESNRTVCDLCGKKEDPNDHLIWIDSEDFSPKLSDCIREIRWSEFRDNNSALCPECYSEHLCSAPLLRDVGISRKLSLDKQLIVSEEDKIKEYTELFGTFDDFFLSKEKDVFGFPETILGRIKSERYLLKERDNYYRPLVKAPSKGLKIEDTVLSLLDTQGTKGSTAHFMRGYTGLSGQEIATVVKKLFQSGQVKLYGQRVYLSTKSPDVNCASCGKEYSLSIMENISCKPFRPKLSDRFNTNYWDKFKDVIDRVFCPSCYQKYFVQPFNTKTSTSKTLGESFTEITQSQEQYSQYSDTWGNCFPAFYGSEKKKDRWQFPSEVWGLYHGNYYLLKKGQTYFSPTLRDLDGEFTIEQEDNGDQKS